MPVIFQPADPVGERIAAQYGATQQANQMAGTIQQGQLAQQQMRSAEYQHMIDASARTSAASAENLTRASLAGSEMGNQRYLQEQRLKAAQQAQQQQFEHQSQMQFNEWALRDQSVTNAEVMRMQRQQMAVDDIIANTGEGKALTESESAEMILQLKTGISLTKQRMEKQHADDFAAQAAMRQEQAKTVALNNETIRGLQLKAAQGQMSTGVMINPITGTPHWVRVDDKGNIVPVETGGKGQPQAPTEGSPEWRTKTGGNDLKAITAAAEYETKKELGDKPHVTPGDAKSAQLLEEWNAKRSAYMEGLERLQKYPGATWQERQANEHKAQAADREKAQIDQRLPPETVAAIPKLMETETQRIDSLPISDTRKAQLKEYLDAAQEIARKPFKTEEDWQKYRTYRRLYEEQSGGTGTPLPGIRSR